MHQGMSDIRPFGGIVSSQWLMRHHLGTPSDDQVHIPCQNGLGSEMQSLLAGTAHAIQADSRHMHRETGFQRSQPCQITTLVCDGSDHTPDHIFDFAGIDPGACYGCLHDPGCQVYRGKGLQGSVGFSRTDGCAYSCDDVSLAILFHFSSIETVF